MAQWTSIFLVFLRFQSTFRVTGYKDEELKLEGNFVFTLKSFTPEQGLKRACNRSTLPCSSRLGFITAKSRAECGWQCTNTVFEKCGLPCTAFRYDATSGGCTTAAHFQDLMNSNPVVGLGESALFAGCDVGRGFNVYRYGKDTACLKCSNIGLKIYGEAKRACMNMGSSLVSVNSQEKLKLLLNVVDKGVPSIWVNGQLNVFRRSVKPLYSSWEHSEDLFGLAQSSMGKQPKSCFATTRKEQITQVACDDSLHYCCEM